MDITFNYRADRLESIEVHTCNDQEWGRWIRIELDILSEVGWSGVYSHRPNVKLNREIGGKELGYDKNEETEIKRVLREYGLKWERKEV